MDLSNPYAPPQAPLDQPLARGSRTGWQLHGDLLVAEKGAVLPDLCIWSGDPANHRVRRKLSWAPPWTAMMGVLLILIFRKTGDLDYAIGEQMRQRRKSGIIITVLSFLMMPVFVGLGSAARAPALILVGVLAFVVMLIVGLMRMQPFRLTKIDKTHIYIKLRAPAAQAFARVAG